MWLVASAPPAWEEEVGERRAEEPEMESRMRGDLGSGEEGMKRGKMRQSSRKTLAVWAPQAESAPVQQTVPSAWGGQGCDWGVKAEDCGVLAVSTGRTGGASPGHR